MSLIPIRFNNYPDYTQISYADMHTHIPNITKNIITNMGQHKQDVLVWHWMVHSLEDSLNTPKTLSQRLINLITLQWIKAWIVQKVLAKVIPEIDQAANKILRSSKQRQNFTYPLNKKKPFPEPLVLI